MKLRIGEKIFIILALVLVITLLSLSVIDYIQRSRDDNFGEACLELAKQDIIAEYGFDNVLWLSVAEFDNLDGRDDFYIFTCLTEEDELHEYRFAVTIREVNGEIDVDTWQIKEGE